ncbi:MAG: hypothetical protein WBD71_17495 [Xanthobacteraceae bacterium]
MGDRKDRRVIPLRAALCGGVAALALCGSLSAARAGDDGVASQQSFTDKFLNTLGLHNPFAPQYGINYSERSPLVVPPTRDLPPPVSSNGPPAPNWPVDPEVKARAAAKKDDSVGPHADYVTDSSRPLRPGELNVSAINAPGTNDQSSASERGEHKAGILNFDWLKQEDYGTFTGEPPRVSLSDPPPGYQTPSPNQPYGVVPEKKIYKPPTLGERMEPVQ